MKDVKIIIKCGIRFSTEPDFNSETVTKIILYNRKLKKTRGLVITYSNDGTIETTRLGDDVEHNLVAEIVYKAPMNLAYLLALFRKDEPLPSPADDIKQVIDDRSLVGSASKDDTVAGHSQPFLSGLGTRPSL